MSRRHPRSRKHRRNDGNGIVSGTCRCCDRERVLVAGTGCCVSCVHEASLHAPAPHEASLLEAHRS